MSGIKRNAVIILGMHRSGTSALAGCLNRLGVKMGSTFLPSNSGNEMGYFEHSDIVLVHDILLSELGCRWDMVGNLPSGWLESEAAQRAKKTLLAIIDREFKGARLWAVKDPRMCRLMPLWFEILAKIGTQPKFAFIVRHPFAVARSLQKRHGIDLLTGHLLWMTHNREALAACRGYEHALLIYDQLLADPVRSLENIGRVLNVSWPRTLRVHYQKILGLVRPELRHEHPSEEGNEQGKFGRFALLYDQLRTQQTAMNSYAKVLSNDVLPGESTAVSDKNMVIETSTSFFPSATVGSETEPGFRAENPVSAVINNLLGLIGKYEQIELGRDLVLENRLQSADDQGGYLFAQVFFPQVGGESEYIEEKSRKVLLVPGEWQKIVIHLPDRVTLQQKRLRLDPLASIGMVAVSAVKIVNSANREIISTSTAKNGFADCKWEGDVLFVSKTDSLLLVSTGHDPRLLLPVMADLPDVPLCLEVWIKVTRDLNGLVEVWQQMEVTMANQAHQLAEGAAQVTALKQERDEAFQEVEALQIQLTRKEETLSTIKVEMEVTMANQAHQLAEGAAQVTALKQERDEAFQEVEALQIQLTRKEETLSTIKAEMLVHIRNYAEK